MRNDRARWLDRHWRPAVLLALLGLAVAGGWAIRGTQRTAIDAIHDSQLRACRRGNLLRAEVQTNVQVLDALLTEAARTRAIQARVAPTEVERDASAIAAARYRELEDATRAVPPVNCAKVVPRP